MKFIAGYCHKAVTRAQHKKNGKRKREEIAGISPEV